MSQGWVKLHRAIVTKDIYLKPPLYLRVFERLIIEANHICRRIPYGKQTKLIKRGERLTSIRQIAEWIGWYERGIFKTPNPKTVAEILNWLVENELIEIYNKGNSQETHYNIVNYCIYQSTENGESNSKVTVNGEVSKQQTDTNNNVKNYKNEKNVKKEVINHPVKLKFDVESIQYKLADYLRKWILKNNESARVPDTIEKMQKWAVVIDRMIRIDKRNQEEIKAMIEFSQKHHFWFKNILSPSKLREQFDRLSLENKQAPKKDMPKGIDQLQAIRNKMMGGQNEY